MITHNGASRVCLSALQLRFNCDRIAAAALGVTRGETNHYKVQLLAKRVVASQLFIATKTAVRKT